MVQPTQQKTPLFGHAPRFFLWSAGACLATALIAACLFSNWKSREVGVGVSQGKPSALISPAQNPGPNDPEIARHLGTIRSVLQTPEPVVRLAEADPGQARAQELALREPRFTRFFAHPDTGEPLLNEIIGCRVVRAAEAAEFSLPAGAHRVELYNFFYNLSVVAWVRPDTASVTIREDLSSAPPEIGPPLGRLAVRLALHPAEIRRELGLAEGEGGHERLVEVAQTRMERSRHLGATPVFRKGDRTLRVLVDLTDLRVTGWSWDAPGEKDSAEKTTERSLQNDVVMREFCEVDHRLARDGWDLTYRLTRSDGLEILDVSYQGQPVLKSAKLVEWHVSYQLNGGFGYTDAMGCPMFSSSKVVALEGPAVTDTPDGFMLVQDFRSAVWPAACNYRYQNRFEFKADGRFRVAGANLGRGCQPGVWYRPVLRIDLASGPRGEFVEAWNGSAWLPWTKEQWISQPAGAAEHPDGGVLRMGAAGGRVWRLSPGRDLSPVGGQGEGEEALVYVSVGDSARAEGDGDLPNIGDCCRSDYRQGPEIFLSPPEDLAGRDLVLWYVPSFQGDALPGQELAWAATTVEDGKARFVFWPAVVGPWFTPEKGP